METDMHFWSHLAQLFLEYENFQTKFVAKIKTRILCSKIFFFNRAFYEIMRKNTVQPNMPQMTIRRMRIACWIPKSTNINSEYVIVIDFPLQQLLHECASILRYMQIDGFGGLVVRTLASGSRVRGFKPRRNPQHAFLRRGN
jgi:hypothetical protein